MLARSISCHTLLAPLCSKHAPDAGALKSWPGWWGLSGFVSTDTKCRDPDCCRAVYLLKYALEILGLVCVTFQLLSVHICVLWCALLLWHWQACTFWLSSQVRQGKAACGFVAGTYILMTYFHAQEMYQMCSESIRGSCHNLQVPKNTHLESPQCVFGAVTQHAPFANFQAFYFRACMHVSVFEYFLVSHLRHHTAVVVLVQTANGDGAQLSPQEYPA